MSVSLLIMAVALALVPTVSFAGGSAAASGNRAEYLAAQGMIASPGDIVISDVLAAVNYRVSRIFEKIGAGNRTEAAAYANRHGLAADSTE